MSQAGFVFPVTAPARSAGPGNAGFFTEALALNVASAMYNIPMQVNVGGFNRRSLIRAISCVTDENFGPAFNFFSSSLGFTTNPDTDKFISRFAFVSAMGERLGGAGLWRYYVDGLAIPYFDEDQQATLTPGSLHVVMQNVSATAKLATTAAVGRVNTVFWLEPMGSY